MQVDSAAFQQTVWEYYRAHGRHDLPWRQADSHGHFDPYKIMVSEVMLQQTQVPRVMPKFAAFMRQFPSFQTLAQAPLADVLRAWSGLGYNRRAKFLWQAAQKVAMEYGGRLPDSADKLVQLPGIGPNTAGAILAYAFNRPVVFIETNIRTVFIYHFFPAQTGISDKELMRLLQQTLPNDASQTRDWYWALMDYGTFLKKTVGNVSSASKSYAKQSAFHGSRRQVRGQVLRSLAQAPLSQTELQAVVADDRLPDVLTDLLQEGLIELRQARYRLHGA